MGDLQHPFFARLWRGVLSRETVRMRELRRRTLGGLSGRVVEVGPGTGSCFSLYPQEVEEVVAVEPEPYLRELAAAAAAAAPVAIRVIAGEAEALPIEEGWADAVVCSLVLCSVREPKAALAEIRRVLRDGGELRLLEHVGAHNRVAQSLLRAAELTFWTRSFGGCRPTRHTLEAVMDAGFDVCGIERRVLRGGVVSPPLPHVFGVAR